MQAIDRGRRRTLDVFELLIKHSDVRQEVMVEQLALEAPLVGVDGLGVRRNQGGTECGRTAVEVTRGPTTGVADVGHQILSHAPAGHAAPGRCVPDLRGVIPDVRAVVQRTGGAILHAGRGRSRAGARLDVHDLVLVLIAHAAGQRQVAQYVVVHVGERGRTGGLLVVLDELVVHVQRRVDVRGHSQLQAQLTQVGRIDDRDGQVVVEQVNTGEQVQLVGERAGPAGLDARLAILFLRVDQEGVERRSGVVEHRIVVHVTDGGVGRPDAGADVPVQLADQVLLADLRPTGCGDVGLVGLRRRGIAEILGEVSGRTGSHIRIDDFRG